VPAAETVAVTETAPHPQTDPVLGEAPAAQLDRTEEYVSQAVAAARRFVQRQPEVDPVRVIMRSNALLQEPPPDTPVPITPRSGLQPPHAKDGWTEGDWLAGWAWDREDRERMLHVAVIRDREPILLVLADVLDRSLDDVPGRERHAFRIPVLPEVLLGERLHLEIWQGRSPLHRARLYVDRAGEPMLRRMRDAAGFREGDNIGRRKHWWSRR